MKVFILVLIYNPVRQGVLTGLQLFWIGICELNCCSKFSLEKYKHLIRSPNLVLLFRSPVPMVYKQYPINLSLE